MRHFLLSGPVTALSFGVGMTARTTGLIARASGAHGTLASGLGADLRAVAVAAIAMAANQYGGTAAGAQEASSRSIHGQLRPMDCGQRRALREILCRQRGPRQGASGRDSGSDLAVWPGVAPAFPPAGLLFTPSPSLCRTSFAKRRLLRNRPPEALRAAKRKTGIVMPAIQKLKSTHQLATPNCKRQICTEN